MNNKIGEAGAKPPNEDQMTKNEPDRKCYWIDSPFPRNLILREKLLVANKGLLTAEVQAGLSAAASTTKADDLAKAEGLSLQGRHLEYADLSGSSLPNADLRRARLKAANLPGTKLEKAHLELAELPGANLSGAELPGADLSGAELPGADLSHAQLPGAYLLGAKLPGADLSVAELPGAYLLGAELPGANLSEAKLPGADLSGAELSGAILENINFAPMEKKAANVEVNKLYSALENLPQYLGDRGQADLTKKMEMFRQEITRSMDFSNLGASEGCLTDESALKYLTPCKKIGDSEAKKIAYETWVRLACDDGTEKHRVAQRMAQRTADFRFRDFAPLLAAKLQIPAECPGLAGLDNESKKKLLDAAKKTP